MSTVAGSDNSKRVRRVAQCSTPTEVLPLPAATGLWLVERRATPRYPVAAEVTWRLLYDRRSDHHGTGKSLNMSSSGILFTTPAPLEVGSNVEVCISWPVALNGNCPLKLVVTGKITRSDQATSALNILRYEFRTRRSNPLRPLLVQNPPTEVI